MWLKWLFVLLGLFIGLMFVVVIIVVSLVCCYLSNGCNSGSWLFGIFVWVCILVSLVVLFFWLRCINSVFV